LDRRRFFSASGALVAAGSAVRAAQAPAETGVKPQIFREQQQQYRIGHTTGAAGGWAGHLFKSFREAREVGYRYVEVFGTSFCKQNGPPGMGNERPGPYKTWPDGYVFKGSGPPEPNEVYYPDDWEGLMHRMYEIGLQFSCITGGVLGEAADFADPALRARVVESHFSMARFSRRFGCDHQKTNAGRRRPGGTTRADLKEIAITLDQLGRRLKEELGMRFGVHAHLFSQIQNLDEIDYVMENTNPDHVGLVLDTGHVTMAGADPVALGKRLGSRVVEYHFKDTAAQDRGGSRDVPVPSRNMMNDPYFYPLGTGGVDFPAIMKNLDAIAWRGFLVVELDASPWRPPKESARITANYFRDVLHLEL
jgi:sugar phosphate isomerase/epimerase